MDSSLVGESAAILTSCLWTCSSLLFTSAGKRIGSFSVNAYRIIIAVGLLVCANVVLLGTLLPLASSAQWFWMGLSGVVGLGIGDFALFAAYVMIGPRRSVLVMASSPIFASVGAYLIEGETFPPLAMLGIAVTLSGITLVLLGKEEKSEERLAVKDRKILGAFSALIAAMGQGFGLALAKEGILLDVNATINPVSAALMRMIFGALFVWLCVPLIGKLPELRKAVKDREGIKYAAVGAVVGPFVGVTLSMVAVAYTQAGIAQTLMSLMPVIIIPVIWIVYRERTSWRGILGALVAVVGVAVIFLARAT